MLHLVEKRNRIFRMVQVAEAIGHVALNDLDDAIVGAHMVDDLRQSLLESQQLLTQHAVALLAELPVGLR